MKGHDMRFTPRKFRPEHIVLAGDSVFDNDRYVKPVQGTTGQLRDMIPAGHRVTMAARDGATTRSLPWQLEKIPEDTTRIILSIGGNDALMNSDILRGRKAPAHLKGIPPFQVAMNILHDRVDEFEADYYTAVDKVLATGLPVTTCTIYTPDYEEPELSAVRMALTAFNDVIIRFARHRGLDVIELRDIVTDEDDLTCDIEPSSQGSAKIAAALGRHLSLI